MSRRGQAIIFTLLFLIPMIVAFGLMMRVDGTINLKIRLQNATDAAAQEGGAQVARVMNQIAVHNNAILKYHALRAATETAKMAANAARMAAVQELIEATDEFGCWSRAVSDHTRDCDIPFLAAQACPKIEPATQCMNCLGQQMQMWQKIIDFWTGEVQFFEERLSSFDKLGEMCENLGKKSDAMVQGLPDQLKALYKRIGKEHRIHVNTSEEEKQWLNTSRDGRPLEDAAWNMDKVFKKRKLSEYAGIAMTGRETGRQETDRGLFNFEGPPVEGFSGQKAKEKKGGEAVDPPWGPTKYYMEYISCVHVGLPGYFNFREMHGPLGNPDSKNPTCGGGQHDGCEGKPPDEQRARQAQIDCNQGKKPCHRDQKTYTADTFQNTVRDNLQRLNDQEFGKNVDVYMLADTPRLEFLVSGRIEADQGFWNRLFKARTVDMPDDGPRDATKNHLRALAKYELYNLTETNGTILSRGQYGQYAKALLTQDWNALMTPIVKDEIPNERPVIKNNMVH